ncbi:hypothetical protein Tco_1410110 [Tanacetum coccineum]
MSSYNHFGCSWCGGSFNGGNCPGCSSVGSGNEFVYDPNPYSYNETSNFFNQPLQHQYETYSCELCGDSPHYGFDFCHNSLTVVKSVEVRIIVLIVKKGTRPSMIRVLVTIKILMKTTLHFILQISNYSLTVVRSVEVPYYSSDCQTRNQLVYEPTPGNNYEFPCFDQPPQYHIDQSPPRDLDFESYFNLLQRDTNRILEELDRTRKRDSSWIFYSSRLFRPHLGS